MKINNNISAVVSNKHLLRNEGYLSVSMEKLSSGFKINHTGDDPSGMAISSKMRAQIRGLDQASQNSSDGTSVLETADGALNEVTEMIQRMRELSVQAANGTNSDSDRKYIQDEIDDLNEEIQRIADSTEFNTKKLLDGSLDKRVYTDDISRVIISNEVPAGKYDFTIEEAPTKSTLLSTKTWSDLAKELNDPTTELGQMSEVAMKINGTGVTIRSGMDEQDIYTLVRKAAEMGEAELDDVFTADSNGEFTSNYNKIGLKSIAYGDQSELEVTGDIELMNFLGWDTKDVEYLQDGQTMIKAVAELTSEGRNAVLNIDRNGSDFGRQSTYRTITKESGESASRSVDGRRIQITDVGGFKIDFLIDENAIEGITEKTIDAKAPEITVKSTISSETSDAPEGAKVGPPTVSIERDESTKAIKKSDPVVEGPDGNGRKVITETTTTTTTGTRTTKTVADDGTGKLVETTTVEEIEIEEVTTVTTTINPKKIELEVTEIGPMNLQIGANEGQQMQVRIPSTGVERLYLDQIDVTSQRGAVRALEQLDEALAEISSTRSAIGAYTNRLEHAIKSLDQTSENMNQAISRIEDVDMAKEMTEYTKYNVLQQASTSALSQANELPQTALQLLQ